MMGVEHSFVSRPILPDEDRGYAFQGTRDFRE